MIDPFVVLGFNVSTKLNKMYNCFSTTRCRQSITFAIFVLRLVFIPLASFFFKIFFIYYLQSFIHVVFGRAFYDHCAQCNLC